MAANPKQYVKQIQVGNALVVTKIKGVSGNELLLVTSGDTEVAQIDLTNTALNIRSSAKLLFTDLVSTDPLATDGDGIVVAGV